MCLIIVKPAGVSIDEENYFAGFDWNDNGAGFCYIEDDKLVVDKGYMKFKKFMKAVRDKESLELVIHFRRASPGMVINEQNCHPFEFKSKTFPNFSFAMVHNGRLDYHFTHGKSDTRCFAEEVLFPHLDRDPWFLDDEPGRFILKQAINKMGINKMVVMRWDAEAKKSEVYIINPEAGIKDLKCWFSNDSYKPWVNQKQFTGYEWDNELQAFAQPKYNPTGMGDKYAPKLNPVTKELEPWSVWSRRELFEKNQAQFKRLEAVADKTAKLTGSEDTRIVQAGVIHARKSAGGEAAIEHVGNKEEKAIFKRACWDYYKAAQTAGLIDKDANFNIWEAIAWTRDDFKRSYGQNNESMHTSDAMLLYLAKNNPDKLMQEAETP